MSGSSPSFLVVFRCSAFLGRYRDSPPKADSYWGSRSSSRSGCSFREVRRRFSEANDEETTYWIRAGAVTGLVAIGLQEVGEFSLQMPGNALLFTVLAAIAIHQGGFGEAGRSGVRRLEVASRYP